MDEIKALFIVEDSDIVNVNLQWTNCEFLHW